MNTYVHVETISSATVFEPPKIPKGRNRHQFDFGGTSGSVTLEADFGTGYRAISTIDLTKTDRVPFVIEAAVLSFRVTPPANTKVAYYVNEVS